jgi:hypothetical protein
VAYWHQGGQGGQVFHSWDAKVMPDIPIALEVPSTPGQIYLVDNGVESIS